MRAAYITELGLPDLIMVGELPDPPPPTGSQVLVEVKAASVNPIDTYIRSGKAAGNLNFPFVVGSDLAGVVRAVGPDATMFKPGMRVWGANQGILGHQGTFSQLAVVDEEWLYPTPDNVPDEAAAAMSLVGITTHLGLVEEANIQPGETLLLHGASGAVGSTAIEMAKALGARVIAVTSGGEKLRYVRSLGADEAIDRGKDVLRRVKEVAPAGVNVWWETSGHVDLDLACGAMAPRGRILLMAGRGARVPLPVGPFYTKCLQMRGFVIFQASPAAQRRAAEQINRWLSGGVLTPKIDRVGSLCDAAEFHRLQEESTLGGSGAIRGKLVVKL